MQIEIIKNQTTGENVGIEKPSIDCCVFDEFSENYPLRDEVAEDKFVDELARIIVFVVKSSSY